MGVDIFGNYMVMNPDCGHRWLGYIALRESKTLVDCWPRRFWLKSKPITLIQSYSRYVTHRCFMPIHSPYVAQYRSHVVHCQWHFWLTRSSKTFLLDSCEFDAQYFGCTWLEKCVVLNAGCFWPDSWSPELLDMNHGQAPTQPWQTVSVAKVKYKSCGWASSLQFQCTIDFSVIFPNTVGLRMGNTCNQILGVTRNP